MSMSNPRPEYDIERMSFMIVDDNKHMRVLVKHILNSFGVRNICEASDGADAFKELKTFSPDIVICDWEMDPLDGIDFVRLVRKGEDSPNHFMPIIMLTGYTETSRVLEARDAGIHEFLAKPISAKALYSRIRSIIDNPRQFIRAPMYFGPCRRRSTSSTYRGPNRRQAPADEGKLSNRKPAPEPTGALSQSEIDGLLNTAAA